MKRQGPNEGKGNNIGRGKIGLPIKRAPETPAGLSVGPVRKRRVSGLPSPAT